jgi:hypothetical protein
VWSICTCSSGAETAAEHHQHLAGRGRILTFPAASDLERIEAGDPQCHGVARRHPQLLQLARPRNFAVERRQATLLLGQEALLQ